MLKPETLALIQQGDIAKGDVLAVARVAGIQAAKRTSELIPLCHPLPLSKVAVDFELRTDGIEISGYAKTDAKTGVELDYRTDIHHFAPDITGNVQGWVNGGLTFASPSTLRSLENIRVTAPGFTTTFTDTNGNFTLVGAGTFAVSDGHRAGLVKKRSRIYEF